MIPKHHEWAFSIEGNPLFKVAQSLAPTSLLALADIGCGIRPQDAITADTMYRVEPCKDYADWLEAYGYNPIRKTALQFMSDCESIDCVVMFDVIEHMPKSEGEQVIELIEEKAKHAFVFTPNGFMSHEHTGEKDPYGLQGQWWLTHKSGWAAEDFKRWTVYKDDMCANNYKGGSILAVWSNG